MKVLTKDTNEQFNVRPANDYDVKNGHAITDLEILDADGNNSSAWLKADECFIITETGHKVEYLNSEQTETLEGIYDAETDERVKDMIARTLAARYRRDFRPNKREGETKETKMAKVLENVINNCSFSQSKMAKHFCQFAHRYLDQSLFEGFIRQYIIVHAWKWRHSKPGTGPVYYDGRNQYACEACSKIVDALEWGYYLDQYNREIENK